MNVNLIKSVFVVFCVLIMCNKNIFLLLLMVSFLMFIILSVK